MGVQEVTEVKKVALVGLDGIVPEFAEKFMGEGAMPNLKRLKERGFYTESIPSLPAWTPGNWATVVTGAQTSTHGIDGFEIHLPGEPLPFEVYHRGFDSDLRKAETFWEAAAKQGRKTLLFKFPGTWPIRLKEEAGTQIAGAAGFAGLRSYLDVWHGHCFTNDPAVERANPVEPQPAQGWRNIPVPEEEALECKLNIELNRHRGTLTFHGLLYRSGAGDGYDRILVSRSKDGREAMATLQKGRWSDWIVGVFDEKQELEEGGFRFKLIELAPDASYIKLFMTQNHPLAGFTFPDHIAQEISDYAGPFPEHTSLWPSHLGWIDHQTWMELIQDHTDWLIKVATYALDRYEWDIFVTQHHPIDYTQHIYTGAITPSHPDYNEADLELGWEGIRIPYQCADRYLGAIIEAVGEDTLVVMTGDHGTEVLSYLFWPNNLLEQAGLLKVRLNEKGEHEPIWSETKAYAHGPNFVYVNLKSREPEGIVEPGEEYEALREEIIKLLRSAKCEQMGIFPVCGAMRREEADYFGLYGDGVGDVIYMLAPGFDNGTAERMGKSKYRAGVTQSRKLFTVTRQWHDLTGDHSPMPPFSQRNRTLTVFSGPGVRQNVVRRTPIRLLDVAPTISYLIGAPYAAQTEGTVVLDALEENNSIQV
jgi:predicted AlkP superfamily phosphohydrolase/phosphomutase